MNGVLSDGTRRLAASPFEPLGRFLDGHSGLTEARGRRTALAAQPAGGSR